MHALERLIDGFQKFQTQYFDATPELFRSLQEGQRPTTLLIGCCDSRVDPALLLGIDPGEVFTVRNVANLVPPCDPSQHFAGVTSAIQFGVEQLQISRIIIMGHARCGGIRALMEQRFTGENSYDYIGRWIRIAQPARERVLLQMPSATAEQQQQACEMGAILVSLRNLASYPWIRERMEQGSLTVHGWYFDLKSGALLAYSERADAFLPLVCPVQTQVST